MAPFKIPLDAYVLALPIAYAMGAFCVMVTRVPTVDPEANSIGFYDDDSASSKQAQKYDNQFKQFFTTRIKNHQVGVFQNWFSGSPQ